MRVVASPFMQNPQDRATAAIAEDARARIMGAMRPAPVPPAAPRDTSVKGYFDGLARQTRLPANVLWAVSEKLGGDRARIVAEAGRLAAATEQRRGNIKGAVQDLYGEDATSLLERSFDIAADFYPRAPEDEPGAAGDLVRSAIGGAQQGTGGAIAGAGRMIAAGQDVSLAGAATGTDPDFGVVEDVADTVTGFVGEGLQEIGGWLQRMGATDLRSMSAASREAIRQSGLEGDLTDPSSLRFAGDPSVRGVAMLAANVLGNLAPVVVAGIVSGGGAAAGVGAAQGFDGGAQTVEQIVDEAAASGALQRESTYYKGLIADGMSPDEALDRTRGVAGLAGGGLASIIAGAGGAATAGIVRGGVARLAGGSGVRRIGASTALGAIEEGAQEAAEGVAARVGGNLAGDIGANPTEATGGDFFMGALGGGPVGAGGGVAQVLQDRAARQGQPLPEAVPSDAPVGGMAPPVAPMLSPPGPIETAQTILNAAAPIAADPDPLRLAAPSLYPDIKAGDQVILRNPRTGVARPITFLGETEDGVVLRADGGRITIPTAAFDGLRYEGDLAPDDADPVSRPDARPDDVGAGPSGLQGMPAPAETEPGAAAPVSALSAQEGAAALPAPEVWDSLTGEQKAARARAAGMVTERGKLNPAGRRAVAEPWAHLPAPIRARLEAAPEEAAPGNRIAIAPEGRPSDPAAAPAGEAGRLVSLEQDDLLAVETDSGTFQYKAGGDREGVTERLRNVLQWNRRAALGATVYEYADGRRVVADGHQRFGLARRLAAEGQRVGMDVFLVREVDGVTPQQAMVDAAMMNIRQGSGTALDAARVLRSIDATDADLDLPPNSPLVRDAKGLRKLSRDAWTMAVNEIASVRDAAVVGETIRNPDLHAQALRILKDADPGSRFEAAAIAQQVESAADDAPEQSIDDLFGGAAVQQSLMVERAKVLSGAERRLRKDIALSNTLADRAGEIEGIGSSQVDAAANAERLDQSRTVAAYLTAQANRKGPISDALTEAARDYARTGNLGAAVTRFLAALRKDPARDVPAGERDGEGPDQGDRRRPEPEAAPERQPRPVAPAQAAPARSPLQTIRDESLRRQAALWPTPPTQMGDSFANYTGRTPGRLFEMMATAPATPEGRRAAADEWVATLGRERGREFYVMMDADGYVLEAGMGRETGVTFSSRIKPGAGVIYATHNHPRSTDLSPDDYAALGLAGTVRAVPHDAKLGPSTIRARGAAMPDALMLDIAGAMSRAAVGAMQPSVSFDPADQARATIEHKTVLARAMSAAGLVDYEGPATDAQQAVGRPIQEIVDVILADQDVLEGLRRAGRDVPARRPAEVDRGASRDGTERDAGRGPAERGEGSDRGGDTGVEPDDFDAALDDVFGGEPEPALAPAATRPLTDIAADMRDVLRGLEEADNAFAPPVESAPPFTLRQQAAYARLRPLFDEALSGRDLTAISRREAFAEMARALAGAGMTREDVTALRPFFEAHHAARMAEEAGDVSGEREGLERDRGDGAAGDAVGGADVPAAGRPDGDGAGARGSATGEGAGVEPDAGGDLSAPDAAAQGSRGDRDVAAGDRPQPDGAGRADAAGERGGSDPRGDAGRADDDGTGAPDAGEDAGSRTQPDLTDRGAAMARADRTAVIPADAGNIAATLPLLLPEQRDDVLAIERRFTKPDGHGMLVTNGTGTGKTYSGGGVIKRMVRQGKSSILIVAPSEGILNAWIAMGEDLVIPITRLPDTASAGEGVVATTYANLGANGALASRDWDMVVADEAHTLMSNAAGEVTGALRNLRAITGRPKDVQHRARMLDQDAWDALPPAAKRTEAQQSEATRLANKARAAEAGLLAKPRSKVLFLSATPFAYDKTVDYAEGYLFDYGQAGVTPNGSRQDGRNLFMVANFGYRIRYHKLTEPEAGVDRGVFERQLHERLRREGALIGRSLSVATDYDRRFIAVESKDGEKIDAAMDALRETARGATEQDRRDWFAIEKAVRDNFNYLSRMQLLEAIKAEKAVPLIRAHLDRGRKAVVFHDFNVGGGSSPFIDVQNLSAKQATMLARFRSSTPSARDLDFSQLKAPIVALREAFGDRVTLYNGRETARARRAAIEAFNRDGSGVDVIVVQSDAGAAGISLHDTTGGHQRVLFNLGMPTKPTTTLQQEGRIRRVGSVSDAMFRYMTIGTAWERQAFAARIAAQSGTVENLAMGDAARKVREGFIGAYLDASGDPIGQGGEGVGGVEADQRESGTSPEQAARSHYFGRLKDNRRRDQRSGIDHYATPEPVGQAMTRWADLRPLERALEPSAGDGAIARYLRGDTERTIIEWEPGLLSTAELHAIGANAINDKFENHNVVNKYHAVVMNPPYGRGGATAVAHVEKAMRHVRPGGRIVALIPTGPAADSRFDKMMEGEQWTAQGWRLVAEMAMPAVTFERAGTSVMTRILVMDRPFDPKEAAPQTRRMDITGAQAITDLFDRVDAIDVPRRPEPAVEAEVDADDAAQPQPAASAPASTRAPTDEAERFETFDFPHTKTGVPMFGAQPRAFLSRPDFLKASSFAKALGGYYSSYASGDAKRGFLFKTASARDAFKAEVADMPGLAEDASPFSAAADLRARLAGLGLADRVALRFARSITGADVGGYAQAVINVATGDTATLDHEAIHALRDPDLWGQPYGAFTQAEWRALVVAARRHARLNGWAARNYGDLASAERTEETIAEMFAEWRQGVPVPDVASGLLGRVRDIIDAVRAALGGRGPAPSTADVFRRVASGEVGRRGGEGSGGAKRRARRAPADTMTPRAEWIGEIPTKLRETRQSAGDFFSNFLTDAMSGTGRFNALSLVPGRPLLEELGSWSHALRGYLRLKEEMDAQRNDMQARTADIAHEWLSLAGGTGGWGGVVTGGLRGRRAKMEARAQNEAMMDLMHRATLSGTDPTKAFEQTRQFQRDSRNRETPASLAARREHAPLRAEFLALPDANRRLVHKVAQAYLDTAKGFEDAIEANMKTASAVSLKRAERAHRKELERIADEGLTGREAAEARAEADAALEAARGEERRGRAARLASLRKAFESNRVPGVYFPLARFGQYFVIARDREGAVVSFSRTETAAEQKAEAEAQRAEGYDVATGLLSNADEVRSARSGGVDPQFMADVEAILSDAGAGFDLRDAVWQRWLETLPDFSARKNRIHRKGRAGFASDAIRAFTHHQFHAAHQLARLTYGMEMGERLAEAEDEAKRQDDPNRAQAVVNEARLRHEFAMKPTGAAWSAAATSLAFVWYLGLTPAAAIVNLSQTTVMGPAIMSAAFPKQGTGGALRALRGAARDMLRPKDVWKAGFNLTRNVEGNPNLSAREKAALVEAIRRGTIDKSQAHDIASVAETGIEYNDTTETVMRAISAPFHYAEVTNRMVTFLGAYRMAMADGAREGDAIDRAASLTRKTHFSYQNTDRPRVMQGNVAKVITTFRQFTVNMLFRAARDLHQWQNGATEAERAEAKRQFLGITLSMMAHAGITGTWGYGIATMLLGMLVPGADDEDIDRMLQNALLIEGDGMGAAAWNYSMGMALKGVPGQVTGTALSERLGMPNLWFRDQSYELEGREWMERLLFEMAGPVLNIPVKIADGLNLVWDRNWVKGAEAAAPKVIRDMVRGTDYLVNGVTTRGGETILDDTSVAHTLKTMLGFMPADVAERYEQNARMRGTEREITLGRRDTLAVARRSILDDGRLSAAAIEAVMTFNRAYPEYPITMDTIRRSVDGARQARARSEFGVRLNPRLNDRIRGEEPPLIYG